VPDDEALACFIVEDHNEVLPHIHKAIRDKILPFRGSTLVHFDAHPDLLFPAEIGADVIYEPHELYEAVSIVTPPCSTTTAVGLPQTIV